MKYFIFIILLFLTSCKSIKLSQQQVEDYKLILENYKEQVNSLENKSQTLEKSLMIYKDSLIQEKSLREHSQSFGRDSSFLETTYATSLAYLSDEGLYHDIQNKDSIPTKIKYIYIKDESHSKDSILDNKVQTKDSVRTEIIYKDKEVIKEVIPFWSKMKFIGIGLLISLVVFIILKIKGIF